MAITDSAYKTLQQAVQNDYAEIERIKKAIFDAKNDATINRFRQILSDQRVAIDPMSWIDASNVWWRGTDAQKQRTDAIGYIGDTDRRISSLEALLADYEMPVTGKLARDIKAVTDYEKASPTLKSQLAMETAQANAEAAASFLAANQATLLIGSIVFLILVIGVIIYLKNKKTKSKVQTT